MFNENIVISIIVAIPPTLAVIVSAIINLRTTQEQNVKLDEIHVLANDNFSKALAKIDRLEKIIRENAKEKLEEAYDEKS